ncbi:MAG TPA: glycosyltransferase family 1 protein [Candidatus Saccharimonadales bacterium]|nr:glycosyltransferase family 1 protein [Candidatus Saccharimonadales bacterium]
MKVGIEGSLFFKRSSGVGYYAKRLIEAATKKDSDINFEIVRHWLVFKKFKPPLKPSSRLSYRLVKWFPPIIYYQVFKRLNWFIPYDLVALRKYDAFLFFNFIAFPLRKNTKSIIVVHDISFIKFPQFTQAKNLKYTPKLLRRSIKRAAHIITVSENSKKEIAEFYKLPPDRITVIPNGVDHERFYPRPAIDIGKVRQKYSLPENYIHFHGTIEPRKNIEGILDAYAQLDTGLKTRYALVLSGGKGWNDEGIYRKIGQLQKAGNKILLLGYIENEELAPLLSGASVFIWPSFYEGFGVPPLEAMACGVPVITSNSSSLPEVVGDAAIKIRPEDTRALTAAINQVLSDTTLASNLSRAGLSQSKKYTWEASAQKLIKLLDSLSNSR